MRNLAIIPARSGSKGLKDKNIRILKDKPMIAYSIIAAQKSNLFSEIMVSTDSIKYAEISKKWGASVPFLRSVATSIDTADSWSVVREVLSNYYSNGIKYDTVCLLQPTSPLRTAEDIIEGYKELNKKKDADAITSVCAVDHSPLWMMTLGESFDLTEFRNNSTNMPRQQLKSYYRLNGALYIRKLKYSEKHIYILDKKEYAYIMDRKNSVDIDTIEDFEYAEFLMRV